MERTDSYRVEVTYPVGEVARRIRQHELEAFLEPLIGAVTVHFLGSSTVEERADPTPLCPYGCGKLWWARNHWWCPVCIVEWPESLGEGQS